MTILITGATGLIGTQLSAELIRQGHTIHYLTTNVDKLSHEPNYKGFLWSLIDSSIDDRCFEDVNAIIHLVGATVAKSWTEQYKQTILESRVTSIRLITDRLKIIPHSVNHFVSASGVSIYPSSIDDRFNESSDVQGTGFLASVVVAWEVAADQIATLGISVTKVRTGVVFSKKGSALQKIALPVKYYVGSPLGSGKQWLSWIHLDDICGVYTHILDNKIAGIVNAVAPKPVNNAQLTNIIGEALGKAIILPNVPRFVLKALLGERASLVLDSQYVEPQKLEQTGYYFKYPEIQEAVNDLLS